MARERFTDHDWSGPDRGEIDLGHGTTASLWWLDAEHTQPGGLWEWHTCLTKDHWGPGSVIFDVPGNEDERVRWQLESLDPLTVSPSVACTTCGHHGFIRQGAWVPA